MVTSRWPTWSARRRATIRWAASDRMSTPRRLREFYFANRDGFETNPADFLLDSEGEDYSLEENIYAAYVMSDLSLGSLDLVAGLRIEHTDQSQRGFRAIVNEDVEDGFADHRAGVGQ